MACSSRMAFEAIRVTYARRRPTSPPNWSRRVSSVSFTDWELIDDGSFNGLRKWIRSSDDDEGTVQVRYEGYDVPVIIDRNKKAQSEWNGRFGEGGLHHAAHIPASVLLQWVIEDGEAALKRDPDYLKRKLN